MTPMERVSATLGHEVPDRVPFFLLLTTHGADEFNVSIEKYFSNPEMVAEAQIRMQQKYGHDCYYAFYYASLEAEAWGGNSIFYPDAPPNSGRPIIDHFEDIHSLEVPDVAGSAILKNVLRTIEVLKQNSGNDIPIIGVVMSPFSLPTMQMGFGPYLDLIYDEPEAFRELMNVNEEFCVQWANLQVEAGATAICYFDPVSSSTMIPPELYRRTGFKVARKTISQIKAPTVTHMASGRCLPVIDDIMDTGTVAISTSSLEPLSDIKAACKGKVTVAGNLNGLEMRHWSPQETEDNVRSAIEEAADDGGFILSDNHGDIPYGVSSEVLMDLSSSAIKWGQYR
ncbi:uroporphyrinogen decarboxylase [Methanolobus profundi]|uniref:Uroporphyrinogen decarboxylase n=2 Tax=Methanolobus profundi TaxID=487685 RepID=A0A1I4UTJ6_9EURY|nr:uroporphyrinogen decarboxylase [Methanolobus profundi]